MNAVAQSVESAFQRVDSLVHADLLGDELSPFTFQFRFATDPGLQRRLRLASIFLADPTLFLEQECAVVAAKLLLELTLFLGGLWWLYRKGWVETRRLRNGLLALAGILAALQITAAFGPPPPSVIVVAVSGIVTPVVITVIVYWLERELNIQ